MLVFSGVNIKYLDVGKFNDRWGRFFYLIRVWILCVVFVLGKRVSEWDRLVYFFFKKYFIVNYSKMIF